MSERFVRSSITALPVHHSSTCISLPHRNWERKCSQRSLWHSCRISTEKQKSKRVTPVSVLLQIPSLQWLAPKLDATTILPRPPVRLHGSLPVAESPDNGDQASTADTRSIGAGELKSARWTTHSLAACIQQRTARRCLKAPVLPGIDSSGGPKEATWPR